MPNRIPYFRPAALPGTRGPRAVHQGGADRLADNRFYASTRWRKLRASVLAESPLCARCDEQGRTTLAVHVHHLQERKERPDLALDRANLQSLCLPCHNAVRAKPRPS